MKLTNFLSLLEMARYSDKKSLSPVVEYLPILAEDDEDEVEANHEVDEDDAIKVLRTVAPARQMLPVGF